MKISILMFTVLLTSGMFLTQSCESASEKVKEEQKDLDEANEDLDNAKADLKDDVQNFKNEQVNVINENEQKVTDYRMKIIADKKSTKEMNTKIDDLEAQNKALRIKMDEYKGEGIENWENFKNEFKHDMNEFGKAFKNVTSNDVK